LKIEASAQLERVRIPSSPGPAVKLSPEAFCKFAIRRWQIAKETLIPLLACAHGSPHAGFRRPIEENCAAPGMDVAEE
jgi:hypothetical protein